MTPAELARLFDLPAEAGSRAQAARAAQFGRRVLVRGTPPHAPPQVAALLRAEGPPLVDQPGWSEGHVSSAMADATGRRGQVGEDMAVATGANGQGTSDMSDKTGAARQGASDRSRKPAATQRAASLAPGAPVEHTDAARVPAEAAAGSSAADSTQRAAGSSTAGSAQRAAGSSVADSTQRAAGSSAADSTQRVAGSSADPTQRAAGSSDSAHRAAGSSTDAAGDPGWPEPSALRAGDRLVLQVDRARLGAYFDYLVRLAGEAPDGLSLAPFCARAGGLMRLHLIAAARIALPGRVRVEARHDLLGIRLAQVALGFGADTLAGPLAATRKLPLAGVPRPDEATPAGLAALIERAGLEPVLHDMPSETLP